MHYVRVDTKVLIFIMHAAKLHDVDVHDVIMINIYGGEAVSLLEFSCISMIGVFPRLYYLIVLF